MSNDHQLKDTELTGATPEEKAQSERESERLEIGRQLRSARLAARMTQAQLAAASGVPQSELSKIENGQVEPSYARYRKVIRATGGDVPVVHPAAMGGRWEPGVTEWLRRALHRSAPELQPSDADEPCGGCGEETAAGSVFFSDRRELVAPDGSRRFLCGDCRAKARAAKGGKPLTGADEWVVAANGLVIGVGFLGRP